MKYGLVSVEATPREAQLARAVINGLDVTRDCYAANDVEGWADCFVRDAAGNLMLTSDRTAVQTRRLRGDVVIDFPRGLE